MIPVARANGRGSAPMNLTISQARAYSNRSMLGEMVTVALGKSYVNEPQHRVDPGGETK
jgi:hypothetical protein